MNALASRYLVALLEQLGAVAAPVTDHKRSARGWFNAYRELAIAGVCIEEELWSFVAYPVGSCRSDSSSRRTTRLAPTPSATAESEQR